MTTVNNIEDLARILETQPHWAATLRTLLLSAELLALPETVADLAETVADLAESVRELQAGQERLANAQEQLSERFDQLANAQEQLSERFDQLANAQEQLSERFDQLANAQQQLGERFDQLANAQEQLGERFDQLANAQEQLSERFDRLVAEQERLAAAQEQLSERFDRLVAEQERLAATQEKLIASVAKLNAAQSEMAQDIRQLQEGHTRLEARQDRMETLLGHLVGSDLEARLHRRIRPLVSQRLRLRQTSIKQSNLLEPDDAFFNEIATALNDGVITAEQEQRISETDFIMRARRTGSDGAVWVAAEVANRLDASDITRARDTAEALAAIYDAEVVPVVIGYRIDEIDDERATAAGVRVIIMQPAYLP